VGMPFLWKKNSLRSDTFFWQKRHPHPRADFGIAADFGICRITASPNPTYNSLGR